MTTPLRTNRRCKLPEVGVRTVSPPGEATLKTRSFDVRAMLVVLALAASFIPARADEVRQAPIPTGMTRVLQGVHPDAFGGGPIEPPTDLITDTQREAMRKEVDATIEHLRRTGRLSASTPDVHPLFAWPLRLAPGLTDFGYHSTPYFVDLDPNYPNLVLDYNCGTRSYDRADGYNHQGTDFSTWPWSWRKMDRGEVQVVAAAAGQIVYRSDGNFDRSCDWSTTTNWNAIQVRHADGSMALYGHMKNGSVTPKQVGEIVAQGEYLGVVGSSGVSNGPHLHFEIYDGNGQLIDPSFGPCNNLTSETWWASQRPYYDSAVNRMTTGPAQPTFFSCPGAEVPNAQVSFPAPPITVYFTTYYRDQLDTQASHYTIRRPDGTIFTEWTHAGPNPHYPASYWFWSYGIGAGEMQGLWSFTVEFNSNVYEQQFTVGSPGACGRVPERPSDGELLLLQKIGGSVRLTFGASCNPSDTDYVVYQGTIGSYYSHTRVLCSTGGGRMPIVTPPPGNWYFLVGPRNATREGSLGQASNGTERPGGTISCFTRLALACP